MAEERTTPAKPVPAVRRTLSLFTGKTDEEDPRLARDGVPPSDSPPPPKKGLRWEGGVTRWWVKDGPHGDSYVIERDKAGTYHASYFATKLGSHPDIIQAGRACEEHAKRRR